MAISVKRGGLTSTRWYGDGHDVRLHKGDQGPTIDFCLPSKGGGTTEVRVSIDQGHFSELAWFMMQADPQAAIAAFGAAMYRHNWNGSAPRRPLLRVKQSEC